MGGPIACCLESLNAGRGSSMQPLNERVVRFTAESLAQRTWPEAGLSGLDRDPFHAECAWYRSD